MRMPHIFAPGRFTLRPHHVALWTDAVAGDANEAARIGGVLPSIALLLCFNGAGASIDDIMATLDTKPERVLFGEIELEIDRPLRAGLTYSIDTAIVGSEHKHGRKTGPFDKVTLRYALSEGDRRAATVTQTWIISRDA